MARCRECKQREAVRGAGHPLLMPPLHLFGLRTDRDAWCRGCVRSVNGLGVMAGARLATALPWAGRLVA